MGMVEKKEVSWKDPKELILNSSKTNPSSRSGNSMKQNLGKLQNMVVLTPFAKDFSFRELLNC